MKPDLEFKLRLLLEALPVSCCYFVGYGHDCRFTEFDNPCHTTYNCNGKIIECDLPDNYRF